MDIIVYGGQYWDRGAWFRKQQFAQRFANRGHRVFYVEDSVSMIRRKKTDKNAYFKTRTEKINDNLYIITPSVFFPFPRNFFMRRLYNLKILFDLKRILKKFNINNYILWVNRIEFSTNLNSLKCKKIIDLCDDVPLYSKLAGDEKGYQNLLKHLEISLSQSDIQVVSAQKIKEKYGNLSNKEIIVIPNGHNIQVNNKIEFSIPDDMKSINGPIIGFLGTLFRFTDDVLLEYIISRSPGYSFVFIGGVESNFPITKLNKYNNVYLLGKKAKENIPSYIKCFDVCINPFKIHEVNDSVNPVKVYEYLAMKKQVISTQMYSLKKEMISQFITFADSYEEFLNKLDCIVQERKYFNDIPDDIIEYYHWDNLFKLMLCQLNEKHNLEL